MSFDELLMDLKNAKTIDEDPNNCPLHKLFHESFMREHSNSTSFQEFLAKGNFQAKTHEEINNLHGELFDRHVARETDFADWKSMLRTANMGLALEKDH